MAECMAKRWVNRLNVAQLQKISSLSEDLGRERSQGRLTVARFIQRVRAGGRSGGGRSGDEFQPRLRAHQLIAGTS
jgi:hypothetical protein